MRECCLIRARRFWATLQLRNIGTHSCCNWSVDSVVVQINKNKNKKHKIDTVRPLDTSCLSQMSRPLSRCQGCYQCAVLKPCSSLDPVTESIPCHFALGIVAPQCSRIVTDTIKPQSSKSGGWQWSGVISWVLSDQSGAHHPPIPVIELPVGFRHPRKKKKKKIDVKVSTLLK